MNIQSILADIAKDDSLTAMGIWAAIRIASVRMTDGDIQKCGTIAADVIHEMADELIKKQNVNVILNDD